MAAYITEEQLGTYWRVGDHLFYVIREEGKIDQEKMIRFEEEGLVHKVLPFVENGKQLVLVKCVVLSKNFEGTIYKLGILKEDGTVGREIDHDVKDGELAQIYRDTYYQAQGKIHAHEVADNVYKVKYLFRRIAESEKNIERFYKLMYSEELKRAVELEDMVGFRLAYVALFSEEDFAQAEIDAQISRNAVFRALPLTAW